MMRIAHVEKAVSWLKFINQPTPEITAA